jgi:hypothetical protein
MKRSLPFPGFSRGIPIVGQAPDAPPAGLYYYQVPVLVMRDGQSLTADSLEFRFPQPLEGLRFKALPGAAAEHLKKKSPELAEPKVVVLAPFFLGFVPQEVIDKAAATAAAAGNGAGDVAEQGSEEEEKPC